MASFAFRLAAPGFRVFSVESYSERKQPINSETQADVQGGRRTGVWPLPTHNFPHSFNHSTTGYEKKKANEANNSLAWRLFCVVRTPLALEPCDIGHSTVVTNSLALGPSRRLAHMGWGWGRCEGVSCTHHLDSSLATTGQSSL